MILLQASQLGSFLLMIFMGAVFIIGLPTLTGLFRTLFNKYVPKARLEERPFYYKTLATVASVGLAVCTVALFLFLVFFFFG